MFLPRLVDGELPFRSGRAKADPEEERRLLYVGITRARRFLFLTWPTDGRAQPSPFLEELELALSVPPRRSATPRPSVAGAPARARRPVVRPAEGVAALAGAGRRRARVCGLPRRDLEEIAERKPQDWADLGSISGVGPAKLERYADEVLAVVSGG